MSEFVVIENIRKWSLLGWYDFVFQYRRTRLGPAWQSIQIALWAFGLILVFGPFHSGEPDYIPYVVAGLIVWNFLSSCITDGTNIYIVNKALILNIPNPLALYVVRRESFLFIKFCFQMVVYVLVAIYFDIGINYSVFMLLPGVVLTLICFGFLLLLFGVIGARNRDFEHMVSSVMRFLFFASPVFWMPVEGSLQMYLIDFNPMAWFIELLRAPLMGEMPDMRMMVLALLFTLVVAVLSIVTVKRYGRHVPTWL